MKVLLLKMRRRWHTIIIIQPANKQLKLQKKAGVKKLLLNHISARYTGKAAYQLAYQVRNIIPDTRVVNDFDVIDIPFKK